MFAKEAVVILMKSEVTEDVKMKAVWLTMAVAMTMKGCGKKANWSATKAHAKTMMCPCKKASLLVRIERKVNVLMSTTPSVSYYYRS